MTHQDVQRALEAVADPAKKDFLPRFFKTGPGQYGEGDIFLGVTVPQIRKIARMNLGLALQEAEKLLQNPVHECRQTALIILVMQYVKADDAVRKTIVDLYLRNTAYVNNWDLVDSSAPYILGAWLDGKDASVLDALAASGELWKQRIAIVATLYFIRKGVFSHTLRIAEALIDNDHDLIHKAVGWMLREVGKQDVSVLESFLRKHARTMPRTALRYAIEKFDEQKRKEYLRGEV